MSYKISQAAKVLGVSQPTLRRWDKAGILVAKRTVTGYRYYTQEQIEEFLSKSGASVPNAELEDFQSVHVCPYCKQIIREHTNG